MPGFQLRPAGVFPIGDRLKGQQNCQSSFEIARSSFYYRPRPESAEELDVLKRLDRIFTDHPVYGSLPISGQEAVR